MKPLLSIVVPTKDRYCYLKYLVLYFNSVNSPDIELIIQDNSTCKTTNDFLQFLTKINNGKIKYFFKEGNVSVVENCDLAIKQANGEYILMLGDDDIFSKKLIPFLHHSRSKGVDAIISEKIIYTWPDVTPRFYGKRMTGVFTYKESKKKISLIKTITQLKNNLKNGGTNIANLPCVYQGVIKKELLDKVFKATGTYFPGPSPDMANAVALSLVSKQCIYTNQPFIVAGQSLPSAAGKGAQGEHYGDIEKMKHLPKETAAKWTKKIPFYWSGLTIYSESTIKALTQMNEINLADTINYNYLYASCLVFDTNFTDKITDCKNKYSTLLDKIVIIPYFYLLIWTKRIIFHLLKNHKLLIPNLKYKSKTYFAKNTLELAEILDQNIPD